MGPLGPLGAPACQVFLKAADPRPERRAQRVHHLGGGVLSERAVTNHALQQDQPAKVATGCEERGNGPSDREPQYDRPV